MRARVLLLLLPLAASGCAMLSALKPPPVPAEWSREKMSVRTSSCWGDDCRLRLVGTGGRVDVRAKTREYSRHQIPGWGEPAITRGVRSVAYAVVREVGGTTERTRIWLGTRTVTRAGWRLHCSVFWMQDEEQEKGEDSEVETTSVFVRAYGHHCHGGNEAGPDADSWRFSEGIAPPRDSLAQVYDSLVAAGSPSIGPAPPVTLERLAADGSVAEVYRVRRELVYLLQYPVAVRLHIDRDSGAPLARLNLGHSLDFSPDATDEERNALRLVAAALLAAAHQASL